MTPTTASLAAADLDLPIDEVGEFVNTLLASPAERLTACPGWTVHELVAHLAAGAAEESELVEAHVVGEPERPTRSHEEREQPFRDLPDDELRERLIEEAGRLDRSLERLGSGAVSFTGRSMTAADFALHSRSECTLHRWDVVGRDDVGWAMLAQPVLTTHALGVLASMATLPEAPGRRVAAVGPLPDMEVVVRSTPDDDLVATLCDGTLTLALRPIDDGPADAELEPAARLLSLWGRREPSAPVDLHAAAEARRLLVALFGW